MILRIFDIMKSCNFKTSRMYLFSHKHFLKGQILEQLFKCPSQHFSIIFESFGRLFTECLGSNLVEKGQKLRKHRFALIFSFKAPAYLLLCSATLNQWKSFTLWNPKESRQKLAFASFCKAIIFPLSWCFLVLYVNATEILVE